ncbi:ParB/RepB/Spo0J family partition protein [Bordetella genomosp. 11]|uniref:ParB/Spo0J HTH domain-containing protein n=1 Tax=Bordetella genomosp. 11 TaxID=1416808 RepID=A0A261UIY3_9BORD|nr:hypothetical protein [Bordetella genomosp. 11]OZI61585.1 hypothetical protein CAL28_20085 [Bordetella genomosp. 11]
MAKNSIEAYGAQGKSNVLMFEPGALTIISDPAHPLYDERIHLPLNEAMVLNIMTIGVREPILVWKDPETGDVIVVDGRQRVAHALEANRRLIARGEPPLQVPGVPQRGDVQRMGDIMISMNEARRSDPPMVRARKMSSFIDRGYTDDRLAVIFACSVSTVRSVLALLECTKPVQEAVDAGRISLTHAKALSKMEPQEQRSKVAELVAAANGATPHERARRQAKVISGDRPQLRRKKEIAAAAAEAHGDALHALRWVLGLETTVQPQTSEVPT